MIKKQIRAARTRLRHAKFENEDSLAEVVYSLEIVLDLIEEMNKLMDGEKKC